MSGNQHRTSARSKPSDAMSDSRLHAARKRLNESVGQEDAIEGLREIVANFIGSEEMGLFLVDRKTGIPRSFWSFGADLEGHDLAQTMGESALGQVMRGEFHVRGSETAHSGATGKIQVFIPIRVANTTIAILAILRLLPQKSGFDPSDIELFNFLSNEAAHSLFRSSSAENKAKGTGLGR